MARQILTTAERAARRRAHAQAIVRDEFGDTAPWAQLALSFLAGVQSAQTCLTYASSLRKYFRWCRAQGLDPLAVRPSNARAYLVSQSHLAPCSRANACTAPRSYYDAAIDDELLDRNPFTRVHPTSVEPRVPTPALTEAQFVEVLDTIRAAIVREPGRLVHERDYALVYLMGRLGPRRVSISGTTWGDLKMDATDGPEITFHLKRDRVLTIAVPDDVVPLLDRWRWVLGTAIGRPLRDDDALFPPVGHRAGSVPLLKDGAPLPALSEGGISYQVRGRLTDIGIVGRRWSAHAMRATSITCGHEHGASMDSLQRQAGHKNQSQTAAYIRRRRRDCAAATWTPATRPLPPATALASRSAGNVADPAA